MQDVEREREKKKVISGKESAKNAGTWQRAKIKKEKSVLLFCGEFMQYRRS